MAGPIRTEDLVKDDLLGTRVVHALQGVSLTIQAGEMGTIMGASGYGKSTLMTILGGHGDVDCIQRGTGSPRGPSSRRP